MNFFQTLKNSLNVLGSEKTSKPINPLLLKTTPKPNLQTSESTQAYNPKGGNEPSIAGITPTDVEKGARETFVPFQQISNAIASVVPKSISPFFTDVSKHLRIISGQKAPTITESGQSIKNILPKNSFFQDMSPTALGLVNTLLGASFVGDVGKSVGEIGLKGVAKLASKLPDGLLYKIERSDLPAEDIINAMTGKANASPEAKNFYKNVLNEHDRQSVVDLFNSARKTPEGGNVKIETKKSPTILGKIAGKKPEEIHGFQRSAPEQQLPGYKPIGKKQPNFGLSVQPVERVGGADEAVAQTLRGTKGMTAKDIMEQYPNIKLKVDVPAKDVYGNKLEIPEGTKLTPEVVAKIKGETPKIETSGKQFEQTKTPETTNNTSIIPYQLRNKGGEPIFKGKSTRIATTIKRLKAEKEKIQREALGFILKGKPKMTFRLSPREKLKMLGKEPATTTQIQEAHIIAKKKLYLSEKGKVKPQYRALAKGITGKSSFRFMTKQEATNFIKALEKIPNPTLKNGRMTPAPISTSKALTTKSFFKNKFKEPNIGRFITSQSYYAQLLGVKPLVEPLELAKQNFDLEYRNLSNAVDQQMKIINKSVPMGEKVMAKIKNIPTKAVKEMRDILNKYEEAPAGLSPQNKKVFDWFRNLNKTLLDGENAVRVKLGIEPIKYRKAYVRHIADGIANEMLMGKYPFPEGLKYWANKIVGKKVFNPMEYQRQLSDDVENLFTKDLGFATKSMLWTGLKEIHLSQPLRAFAEQLGALSKDMSIYEGLSQTELQKVREVSTMLASTKKWVVGYVNEVIKGQQTALDEQVNAWIKIGGIDKVFNKALAPFGRSLSPKALTHFTQGTGRVVINSVMGWRPKQLIRNKFQLILNLATYTTKANLKGFMPASVSKNLVELLDKSHFLKTYTGVEELPTNLQDKLEKIWLSPFQWTAISNVKQTMKVAYWDTLDLITKPKYAKYGWADHARTYKEPKEFLYNSEKEILLKEMEFGAHTNQFSYISMGMPQMFRNKSLIPFTRLQSWWQNYFGMFLRDATKRAFTGIPTWSDGSTTLPWSRRLGILRYLILGGAIVASIGYKKSFLLGVAPTYLSPGAQIMLGMYNYTTASSDYQRLKAKKMIYNSWKAFIPGSLAWEDFDNAWTGKKPLKSLFFYTPYKKKKNPSINY